MLKRARIVLLHLKDCEDPPSLIISPVVSIFAIFKRIRFCSTFCTYIRYTYTRYIVFNNPQWFVFSNGRLISLSFNYLASAKVKFKLLHHSALLQIAENCEKCQWNSSALQVIRDVQIFAGQLLIKTTVSYNRDIWICEHTVELFYATSCLYYVTLIIKNSFSVTW